MFPLHDCEIDAIDGSNRERGEHYHLRSLNMHTDETFAEFDITFYATDTSLNHGQLENPINVSFSYITWRVPTVFCIESEPMIYMQKLVAKF
jgi:hypothetical protein